MSGYGLFASLLGSDVVVSGEWSADLSVFGVSDVTDCYVDSAAAGIGSIVADVSISSDVCGYCGWTIRSLWYG